MADKSTLSNLVQRAIEGDAESENTLAQLFLGKAMAVLPHRSSGNLGAEDQEDIAISAVKSFCIGIRKGDFHYQGDKQLYALLYKIIDGKIRKLWQYHFAAKRNIGISESLEQLGSGSGAVNEGAFVPPELGVSVDGSSDVLEQIEVTPDEQETVDRILDDLQTELRSLFSLLMNELDEHPRRLLLAMLEDDAENVQLAEKIGRSVASVERYRKLIREKIEHLGKDMPE